MLGHLSLEIWPSLPLSLGSSRDSSSPLSFHFPPLRNTAGEKKLFHTHPSLFVPHLFPPSGEDGWMGWELGWGGERRLTQSITLSLHQWRRGSRSHGKGSDAHTRAHAKGKSFGCWERSLSAQLAQVCCCGCSCAWLEQFPQECIRVCVCVCVCVCAIHGVRLSYQRNRG